MPLILKQVFTQKADGTEVYSEVVNATGVYNAATNVGGFGAPNPARNALSLIFYGVSKASSADVVVTPLAHDPLIIDKFIIAMTKALNGHLEAYVWAVLVYILANDGTYVNGDVVYDKENLAAPFIKKKVAGVWVTKVAKDLIGDIGVVDQLEINEFPVPQAKEFVNKLNAKQLLKLRSYIKEECGREDYEALADQHNYAKGLLVTATDDFAALAYNEAELKVEEIFAYETVLANG